jgi:hypothetical protein
MGICSANDPMDAKERAFTYGSIQLRVEDEKKHLPKGGK